MDLEKDETILARWLNGELSEKELQDLSQKEDLRALRQQLDKVKELDYPRSSGQELWAKMGKEIMAESKLTSKSATAAKSRRLWPQFIAVAASLLLLVGFFFWTRGSNSTTLYVKAGQKAKQEWQDGSFANANAESRLNWNQDWENHRTVELVGEAFFSVTKGRPFSVQTERGKVEVLGTQFNVFTRGDIFRVICYEGKVQVNKNGAKIILIPGEGVEYFGSSFTKLKLKTSQPDWLSGKTVYQKADLKTVFQEMERQYNITIEVEPVIDGRQFTGQFPHDDLTKALQLVCTPMSLGFEMQGVNIRVIEE